MCTACVIFDILKETNFVLVTIEEFYVVVSSFM